MVKKKTSIITNIIIRISLIILIYYFLNLSLNQKNVWYLSLFLYISLSLSPPLLFLHYCSTSTGCQQRKKKKLNNVVCHMGVLFLHLKGRDNQNWRNEKLFPTQLVGSACRFFLPQFKEGSGWILHVPLSYLSEYIKLKVIQTL